MSVCLSQSISLYDHLSNKVQSEAYVVQRRTSIASVIRMKSTTQISKSPLCPRSWDSSSPLLHRRTVILFNQLYASGDHIGFTEWLGDSDLDPDLWAVRGGGDGVTDNEYTALHFLQKFVGRIFHQVIQEWQIVLIYTSNHLSIQVRGFSIPSTHSRLEGLFRHH
jgi:hypothetical protein